MKRKIGWSMALLLGLATAAGWAQDNAKTKEKEKNRPAAAAVNDPKEPVSVAGPSYIIGGGGNFYNLGWEGSGLTNTLPVPPGGKGSRPLLHDACAGGRIPPALEAPHLE